MKKILSLLAVIALLLPLGSSRAEIEVQTFPEKPENFAKNVDPRMPLRTLYAGAFRLPVMIEDSDVQRTVVVYLAKNYAQTQGFIMIVPDSGMSAEQCLEAGGWKAVADANNLFLMLLEPSDGAYDDDAYLAAATQLADSRDYWRQPEGRNYVVAYGDAVDLTVKFVEGMLPSTWAGIATFGDLSIGASEIVNHSSTELPAWLFVSELDHEVEIVDLLKSFNNCTDDVYSNKFADAIYFPNQQVNDLLLNEQPMSQVRVSITQDASSLNAHRAAYVYDFFRQGTREVAYGNKVMRYTRDLSHWGATLETVNVGGITRSWVQYVPVHLRETSAGKVPLLVALHGAALNGEYFADRTSYIKLAEEFGFIIVFPTGSISSSITPAWNTSRDEAWWDDVGFISALLDTVKEKLPVDDARIYCYGHSAGGMFTQLLVSYLDGTFAAAAGTGCAFKGIPEVEHSHKTPFFLIYGDQDFIGPSSITTSENVRYCIEYFTKYNDCGTITDVDGSYRMGRSKIYVWQNEDGIPMVQYADVEDMPHTATLDGGMLMFQWLSQFSRNEDGQVGYRTGAYSAD